MACLELRKTSVWWYGRHVADKKVYCKNLGVRIEGVRPESIDQSGDRKFEHSRTRAQVKLEEFVKQTLDNRHTAELVQTLHEIKTGSRVQSIPIPRMYAAWQGKSRRKEPGPDYLAWAKSVFVRFEQFMGEQYPGQKEMADVDRSMAEAFMKGEEKRGVAARTYNAELSLLKNAFNRLKHDAALSINPFDDLFTRKMDTVHRRPFTPEELKLILDAAQDDDFCRPLMITGMATAMRRGDACLLKWADVDMKNRFISVKTGKTGAKIQIPIFPLLYDELQRLERKGRYCFPEVAAMYLKNPDGINFRLNRVFNRAGFVSEEEERKDMTEAQIQEVRGKLAKLDPKKYVRKVRELLPRIFEAYVAGGTVEAIRIRFEISKGAVSTYLKRLSDLAGFPVVRGAQKGPVKDAVGSLCVAKEKGLRRVSQSGFHAFRATWVTLALAEGVPVELVKKVTGHTVTDTVLEHYFQPGREDFRKAIVKAMPKMLMAGGGAVEVGKGRDEQLRSALQKMTGKNWKAQRDECLAVLDGM